MSKKVLVTGGAGYIGSAVVKALCEEGASVTVFDDLSEGDREKVDPRSEFIEGDILDKEALEQAFDGGQFDAVVHCAAKKVMFEGEEDPTKYFTHNVGGTINVLAAMEKHRVPKIIFSSTAAVYAPVSDGHPVLETDPVDPQSVYGRTKLMCEMLITEYARLKKIDSYIIFRYFNVAGDAGLSFKEKNPQGVFPLLASAAGGAGAFNIFGTQYPTPDGSAIRDYIHLSDLLKAHLSALESAAPDGIYNLGTNSGYSVRELVAMFTELCDTPFQVVEAPPRKGDVARILADTEKARAVFNWEPTKDLRDMVQDTVRVYA